MKGPVGWVLRQPDGPRALRRATRVTVAGGTGFYVSLYVIGDATMAIYAMFGALPLVMLSDVPGPPPRRARALLAVTPAAVVLVTAGTLLAAHTWTAACGMFVVGFLVTFLGVASPRLAGVGIALQLFYVLPCFPPYAPQTLGSRLAGLALGILLTACAERVLCPDPAPRPYRAVLADAVAACADYTSAVADTLEGRGTTPADPGERRTAARRAFESARPSRVPPAERPTSSSVRDHAFHDARVAVWQIRDQMDRLSAADGTAPAAATLLRHTTAALRSAARGLYEGAPGVVTDRLAAEATAFDAIRSAELPRTSVDRMRRDTIVRETAEAARRATTATRIALGDRPPASDRDGPFWYATTPGFTLWRRRLACHLTPRSVHLQNALRVAVAMAFARLLAGALGMSHGFWVLLATLSLMRTWAVGTKAVLRPAFLGTVAGAAVAALLLLLVGDVPAFYAAALPVVTLVGFTVGTLLGTAWTQAMFTLAFLLLFTQLAVPSWHLSAVRLLDVLVGGALGAVVSLLAWPRGGHGELRRAVADFLTEGADCCRTTVARLRDGDAPSRAPAGHRSTRRAMRLAEETYVQFVAERRPSKEVDARWEAALSVGYHLTHGGEPLSARGPVGVLLPWPDAAARLTELAEGVAAGTERRAEEIRTASPPGPLPTTDPAAAGAAGDAVTDRAREAGAPAALLLVDVRGWLTGLADALARLRT
ncbi:FUSC family protein [Streptomyces netropsis]|uniref:FUSC family protein n=1 Tax=Streptomyces netropsis TaxID=55404 RepID=UPI0037898B53